MSKKYYYQYDVVHRDRITGTDAYIKTVNGNTDDLMEIHRQFYMYLSCNENANWIDSLTDDDWDEIDTMIKAWRIKNHE